MTEQVCVLVGIGSNIDPQKNVSRAQRELREQFGNVQFSSAYRSAPVGRPNQPDYVNAAASFTTRLSASELTRSLKKIETELGRVRDPRDRYAPRTIDLDLVAYGSAVDRDRDLPSSDLLTRWFVAIPCAELWPNWQDPSTGNDLESIARELSPPTAPEVVALAADSDAT